MKAYETVQVFVATKGIFGPVEMPWSEVCMSMEVAGKPMYCQLTDSGYGVQLFQVDPVDGGPGPRFSFPILTGEAGLFRDSNGSLYYNMKREKYTDTPCTCDANPESVGECKRHGERYSVQVGKRTRYFDSLAEAKQFCDEYFAKKNIVLAITEAVSKPGEKGDRLWKSGSIL